MHGTQNWLKPVTISICSFAYWLFNRITLKKVLSKIHTLKMKKSQKEGSQGFEVLRVGLKLKDGKNQELKLIKVPSICKPLTAQPISLCLNEYNHLNRLDLADYYDGQERSKSTFSSEETIIGNSSQAKQVEEKAKPLLYTHASDGCYLGLHPR